MKNFIFIFIICFFSFCNGTRKSNNENINLLFKNANTLVNLKNFKEAIKLYDSIIKLDSTQNKAYFNRGYCKMQNDDVENSQKDFQKSIDLGYNKASAYYNMGLNEIAIHRDSLAIKYFYESLKYNPKNIIVDSCIQFCNDRIIYDNSKKIKTHN